MRGREGGRGEGGEVEGGGRRGRGGGGKGGDTIGKMRKDERKPLALTSKTADPATQANGFPP